MSLALSRKYRPQDFAAVVGQEPIVKVLSAALDTKKLHHAYLFTGTRGVGKTSIARILARCCNCLQGISATPCNTCSVCEATLKGQCLDFIEIDAASQTKVEDTRNLLETLPYVPHQGRYKIYLIDEVHMLSKHSFNALLKSLEEPPSHVLFLLATTDPQRLPLTILSRCLQFHLKPIEAPLLSTHLSHILHKEGLEHDQEACYALAKAARGGLRDGLSLLEQAISYSKNTARLTLSSIQDMLGITPEETLLALLNSLYEQQADTLFATIQQLTQKGVDFNQTLQDLLETLHNLSLSQVAPHYVKKELTASLLEFNKKFSPETLQLLYEIGLRGRRDRELALSPQQGFEMTLLRMLNFTPYTPVKQITPPLQNNTITQHSTLKNTTPLSHTKSPQNTPGSQTWQNILTTLPLSGMTLALAKECVEKAYSEDSLTLLLPFKHRLLFSQKRVAEISEALSKHSTSAPKITIEIASQEVQSNKPAKPTLDKNIEKIAHDFQATIIKS